MDYFQLGQAGDLLADFPDEQHIFMAPGGDESGFSSGALDNGVGADGAAVKKGVAVGKKSLDRKTHCFTPRRQGVQHADGGVMSGGESFRDGTPPLSIDNNAVGKSPPDVNANLIYYRTLPERFII
jgi:hypothetical protein